MEEKKSSYTGYTEARKKANEKYLKESVEDIRIRVPKGQKNVIKSHSDQMGESMNAFIIRAINEAMVRDSPAPPTTAAQAEPDQQSIPDQPAEHSLATPESTRQKPRRAFTKEAAAQIDTEKLLKDFRYQLDIAQAYGEDVLARLLSEARQQLDD